jgi:predicted alpha/beta superfamily hydrolase
MTFIRCILALAVLCVPLHADAQGSAATATSASPSIIDGSERHMLRASGSGLAYQIDILRVESILVPQPAGYRLPVIYVLDGNGMFPLAAQVVSSSVAFGNRLPAALVVSIGYPADPALTRAETLTNRLTWRTRDLTPPPAAAQAGETGGAAQFLAFIEQDLKPFVASRHPVDASDQTLVGHSFGGLFAAWTLLTKPDAFSRYVLSSPSLFWNDNATIKQADTFAGRPAGPARVFVSVGEMETKERSGGQDMVGVARAFAEALQRRKGAGVGVEVTLHVFPGEAHISVVPGAFMRGLRAVGAFR